MITREKCRKLVTRHLQKLVASSQRGIIDFGVYEAPLLNLPDGRFLLVISIDEKGVKALEVGNWQSKSYKELQLEDLFRLQDMANRKVK